MASAGAPTVKPTAPLIPDGLVDRLLSVDLESLTGVCAEIKVILQNVKKSFESLDYKLSPDRKIRYLLVHAHEQLEGNPRLYGRWLEVLGGFGVVIHSDQSNGKSGTSACFFTRKHVPALTEILAGVSSHWYDIGVSLHLQDNTLKEIFALMQSQPGGKFIFCLTQVLNEWVGMKYEHAKPPTVENLRKALCSATVGLGDVAAKLQESLVEHGISFQNKPATLAERSHDAPLLEIVRQSLDIKVAEEKSTLLEVQAATAHETAISYQWSKDGCPLKDDNAHFIGARMQILCISDAMIASKGIYTCDVKILTESDQAVVVQSEPIVLTVDFGPTTKVLVELYSSALRELQRNSWPPSSDKAYVDLALIKHVEVDTDELATVTGDIDSIKREKEKHVEYGVVFGEYRRGSLILIEGRPGSGKTTLVNKISKDWASGKFILTGAKLVLLISLRGLSKRVDSSMMDVLRSVYHTNDTICSELLAQLEASFGEGVCLILDGLDEYVREEKYKSIIYDIIQKKYLQHSMVIVASRHAASSELRETANMCVEVVGFLKGQILEYVENYPFTSKFVSAEDLKTYLLEHPNILHMCYLPVHASMISFLYSHIRDDLPETESGIYKYFTLFTLLRQWKGKGRLKSLDDLTGNSKEEFEKICELAFDMTTRSEQVFETEDLSAFGSSLGLVTIDITSSVYGRENMYSFFHLTFQEFLAAYHISSLEDVEQMDTISRYGKDKKMIVVWKFFCGLVNFEDQLFKFEEILKLHDNDLFHCQCAFETQQPSVCKSVVLFGDKGGLTVRKQIMGPPDFHSMGYVISNSDGAFDKLTLHSCDINGNANILACSEILRLCTNLRCLDLSANKFGNDGVKMVACRLERFNKSLLNLNLTENEISHEGAVALADGLRCCTSLESLDLEATAMSDDGIQILRDSVIQLRGTLQRLNLAYNRIGDGSILPVSEILSHCSRLTSFKISGNDYGSAGVEILAQSLRNCPDLRSLDLEWIKVDNSGAKVLSESLKSCSNLGFLSLKYANTFDEGIAAISGCLKSCAYLQEISLSYCNISDAGAKSLATGLNHPDTLQRVDLSWNSIGDEGARALAETLGKCQHLLRIDLSENVISSGIKYIVESLPLAVVFFYGNPIGTEGAKAVAESLKNSKQGDLELLDLSNCRMSSEGAVAIAEGLKCSSTLVSLYLQENNIDDTGAEALARVLCCCKKLKTLDLSCNALGDSGVSILADSLKHICNL